MKRPIVSHSRALSAKSASILAALLVTGVGASLPLACTNGNVPASPGGDAGNPGIPDATTPTDSGIPDSSVMDVQVTTDAGDAGPANMHVIALNGLIPVASAVRYCVAASSGANPGLGDPVSMVPQPSGAGLAPGSLTKIQVPATIAAENVRFVVYYTASLTAFGVPATATCADLFAMSRPLADAGLGGGPFDGGLTLQQTLDFDVGDLIPASLLTATSKYLIYSTGCPLSANPAGVLQDPGYCNNDDSGAPIKGDFHVYAFALDETAPPAGKVNVQGLVGVTELTYYNAIGDAPEAWDIGVSPSEDASAAAEYDDSGLVGEGGAAIPPNLLNGPINGSSFPPGGNPFPVDIQSGILPPATALPPLTVGAQIFYVASGYLAFGDGGTGFPGTGYNQFWPIAPILEMSGLTSADLANGTSFTLVSVGDVTYTSPAGVDASTDPFVFGWRIIRNDNL
jgi:hypothetical protein